jgi:hypothetical protein
LKLSIARMWITALGLAAGLHAAPAMADSLDRPFTWPKGPSWNHQDLEMAPNPVRDNGVIRVHFSSDGEAALELFSESGSLVRAWQLRGAPYGDGELQVQMDGVPSGIYILKLFETEHGASAMVASFKVAVRR